MEIESQSTIQSKDDLMTVPISNDSPENGQGDLRSFLEAYVNQNGIQTIMDDDLGRELLQRVQRIEEELNSQKSIKEQVRKLEERVSQFILKDELGTSSEPEKEEKCCICKEIGKEVVLQDVSNQTSDSGKEQKISEPEQDTKSIQEQEQPLRCHNLTEEPEKKATSELSQSDLQPKQIQNTPCPRPSQICQLQCKSITKLQSKTCKRFQHPVRDTDKKFSSPRLYPISEKVVEKCSGCDQCDHVDVLCLEVPNELDELRQRLEQEKQKLQYMERKLDACKNECTDLKKRLKCKREEQCEFKHCHFKLLNKAMSASSFHKDNLRRLLTYCTSQSQDLREKLTLQSMIHSGDYEMTKVLLDAGENVNATDDLGFTPLHDVAGEGHTEMALILLDAGANIDAQATGGIAPLHQAAMYGHLTMCRLLIGKGCTVDPKNDFNATPLHSAAENGHLEVVKLLVEKGADVNAVDRSGVTPWEDATRAGHIAVAMWLAQNFTEEEQQNSCSCARSKPLLTQHAVWRVDYANSMEMFTKAVMSSDHSKHSY